MGEANFLLSYNEHLEWPAEGLSSTGAPGQPVPHRPLTRHGATLFNLVHSALPVPSCRLFQQVAGLPSLASWGSMRVFLAAAAATSDAAGLNILSTSTSTDLQLPMVRACRQACQGTHSPKTVRPELGTRACGSRQAPLAANGQLAARDITVRCSLHIAAVPCPCASHVLTSCGRLWLWI